MKELKIINKIKKENYSYLKQLELLLPDVEFDTCICEPVNYKASYTGFKFIYQGNIFLAFLSPESEYIYIYSSILEKSLKWDKKGLILKNNTLL